MIDGIVTKLLLNMFGGIEMNQVSNYFLTSYFMIGLFKFISILIISLLCYKAYFKWKMSFHINRMLEILIIGHLSIVLYNIRLALIFINII